LRALATAAVIVVGVTGGVVTTASAAPAPVRAASTAMQPETEAPGTAGAKDKYSWRQLLQQALGDLGSAYGLKIGSFDIAGGIAGSLISSIFGDDPDPDEPTLQDVLDKLTELDDIETRLDEMQETLATIEEQVLQLDRDVLMGTCTAQASELKTFIGQVALTQESYSQVVDGIEELRTSADPDGDELGVFIDSFIEDTLGGTDKKSVFGSPLALGIEQNHASLMSSAGGNGVIQTCGRVLYDQWKTSTKAAGPSTSTTATETGLWLDDRQYYQPVQEMVMYWQAAQSQGLWLLQQATIMQAAKLYVAQKGPLATADQGNVCYQAKHTKGAAKAAAICDTAFSFSKAVYGNIAAEWRQVGMPISNDEVVVSLGTDLTGITPGGRPTTTRVWARTPSQVPADWTAGTWTTKSAPVSFNGIDGFVAADSATWKDLDAGYRGSHPGVTVPVQKPVQDPYSDNFAPLDILTTMRTTNQAGVARGSFDTTGVQMVWIPNETATPMGLRFDESSYRTGGTFIPEYMTRDQGSSPRWTRIYDDQGVAVRCLVAPIDGVLCGNDTAELWFYARQKAVYGEDSRQDVDVFSVVPSSPVLGEFEGRGKGFGSCFEYYCPVQLNLGVTKLPDWLARWEGSGGQVYDEPTRSATLWPVAPVPSCTTIWGAVTRCGTEQLDAWLKATVPNPSAPGPQPQLPVRILHADTPVALCFIPLWQTDPANPSEGGQPIELSDFTWTGWTTGHPSSATTTADEWIYTADFVQQAGWASGGAPPASFQMQCSYTAKYADLATTTTLVSPPLTATRAADGNYYFDGWGGEETPAQPEAPAAPEPAPGSDADAGGGDAATLAATGDSRLGALSALALTTLLSGVAATAAAVLSRRRRRSLRG
jgi:hypothetical protein